MSVQNKKKYRFKVQEFYCLTQDGLVGSEI